MIQANSNSTALGEHILDDHASAACPKYPKIAETNTPENHCEPSTKLDHYVVDCVLQCAKVHDHAVEQNAADPH